MAPRFRPRRSIGRTGFVATAIGQGVATCLHYTLTCDPDVALSFENEQDAAWAAAEAFRPMSAEEMGDVRRAAWEAVKEKGAVWWNPPPDAG